MDCIALASNTPTHLLDYSRLSPVEPGRSPHANDLVAYPLERLHDSGMVRPFEIPWCAPALDHPRELADRVTGIRLASACQPLRLWTIHGRAAQDHSRDNLDHGL